MCSQPYSFFFRYFLKALLSLCLLIPVLPVQAQLWNVTQMAPLPEPVSNNAVVEGFFQNNTYVYSFGGIDTTKHDSGIHLRSFRYSVNTDTWERIADLPDTLGKIASAASRIGDVIYIVGGYHVFPDGRERSSNLVHRYSISGNSFMSNAAKLPIAIDDHVQAVWRDSLIYVVTGWSNSENIPRVQIYDPASNQWAQGTPVPDNNTYDSFGASGMIIQDTIYYFGGASMGLVFPIQNVLRKGLIDPQNPTQISWSHEVPGQNLVGYRMAATAVGEYAHWLGGSTVTYNYDGIAYNGSGGVEPGNQNFFYNVETSGWSVDLSLNLPMDLRGIAVTGALTRYLAGGMNMGQQVTDQTLRLSYIDLTPNALGDEIDEELSMLYPNPADRFLKIDGRWDRTKVGQVMIMDSMGRLIREENVPPQQNELNIEELISGAYMLIWKEEDHRKVFRFIKK